MQNPPLPADFAFLWYLKYLEELIMPKLEVGDRILYSVQFPSLGYAIPGTKVTGKIINVCPTQESIVYTIELDMVWEDNMPSQTRGKNIVVGNIWGDSRFTRLDEEFFMSP